MMNVVKFHDISIVEFQSFTWTVENFNQWKKLCLGYSVCSIQHIFSLWWPPFTLAWLSCLIDFKRIVHCLFFFFLKMKISPHIAGGWLTCIYVELGWVSVCVCVCVSVSGYFASFLPVSQAVLPYEAEMTGSYVISPLSLLQVSNLDRKSEDLSPVLPAIVWLSYRSSTAVSAEKCCQPLVARIILS